jgi:hypothetical protein
MGFIDFDRLKAPPSFNEGHDTSLEGMDKGIENHSFDLSTRDAINTLNADKNDGDGQISGKTFASALDKLTDGGQISREEYADMREYVLKNYANMSDDAKKLWDKFDTAYQKASGGDVGFGDKANDGKLRSDAVLSGETLKSLMKDIHTDRASGYKPPHEADGCETKGPHRGGGQDDAGGHVHHSNGTHQPRAPRSENEGHASRSGGAGGASEAREAGAVSSGDSWEVIFAKLMANIDHKESALKARAEKLSNKMDRDTDDGKAGGAGGSGGAEGGGSAEGAEGGGGAEGASSAKSDQTELAMIQSDMQKLQQMTQMLTSLIKVTGEISMSVARNVGG